MYGVLHVLTENFTSRENTRFVFPTQTAAFFWARKALSFFGVKTLAMERFIAWDRFKESCIRTEINGLSPVNSVHRNIFAANLAERNAKHSVFSVLIPKKYSADGVIFARAIARILPLLRLWHESHERFLKNIQAEKAGMYTQSDDEDHDFLTLEEEYRNFLSEHNLFESAWERPPFKETENEYFIFYPELIEDFAEHEQLLKSSNIHIIKIDENMTVKPLYRFNSSREELRAAILEIRRLYEEEKIPYEDMAISVPELETLEPYIKREAELYDVPLRRRSGKPLSRYGAGSFFALVKNCVDNNFSFQSLKALLLNTHLPWRSPEKNERLIRFGIYNNCVSGYRENGVLKDVWEEAFRAEKSSLGAYYKDIKYKLRAIVNSKSFDDIRKYYFVFRGDWDDDGGTSLFLKSSCSDESYDIIARCIEELSHLIRMQKMIPDVTISNVMSFYIDALNEKQYVPEREEGGVNVFQYKVAAAAPFAAHFVLNANQKNAAVIYRGLKFLRPDKRKKLCLTEEDYDASAAFFRAYSASSPSNPHVWYSASMLGFSGWNMPHSFFNDNDSVFTREVLDVYVEEKNWWADSENPFPERLFPVQKKGFSFWKNALGEMGSFNLINVPFSVVNDENMLNILRSAIKEQKYEDDRLRISATGLQSFYKCPSFWLFENIFNINEETLEARLLDDKSKGELFHIILFNLFEKIKNEDGVFSTMNNNIEKYNSWAETCVKQAAAEYKAFHGPLCAPLVGAMVKGIHRHISDLLELEEKEFNGYAVSELESEKKIVYANYILKGRLDRVSVSSEGEPCIFDYKTGETPTKSDCKLSADGRLSDFQMPVYIKLYEETRGIPVGKAVFLSIIKHKAVKILDGEKSDRDSFQPVMEKLDDYLNDYHEKITALDFTKKDTAFEVCVKCVYKRICRSAFSLNSG
jgi:hypothetical protein